MHQIKKIPAIISDIDGVLVRGKYPIPRVYEALQFLRQPFEKTFTAGSPFKTKQFPMVCLTNGGGMLEEEKVHHINQILQLPKDKQFKDDQFLLNFSPLRPILSKTYLNKLILIAGTGKVSDIARSCGLHNFIHIEEYCSLYQRQVEHLKRSRMEYHEAYQAVLNRLDNQHQHVLTRKPPLFDGIFVLNDPIYWEDCLQIILNQIYHSLPARKDTQLSKRHVDIYTVNNDITYADRFRLNRLAFGPFTYSLQRAAKELYNDTLDLHICGKPSKLTYDYAKEQLQEHSQDEIGTIYMIGDNPKSDIRGGNNNGCVSILVRSGVFKGDNDTEDPAQFVVEDFYEAIQLICSREGIPFEDTFQQKSQKQVKTIGNIGSLTKITSTNDIWDSSQYSSENWRKKLLTSYYNSEHNEGQFAMALKLNPEVERCENNMRVTQISEYSNALHNNRIFINPKFTSC